MVSLRPTTAVGATAGSALLIVLAACGAPPEPVPAASVERAQAILQPYKQELLESLTNALEEGGPENAIQVCREEAKRIASRHGGDGIRIGRTSHRLRNPANAPEPWVEPLLQAYVADPSKVEPTAVRVDTTTVGYVEPIRTMSFCLSCHGAAVEPDLAAAIRSLYPTDEATGFHVGDLRGLVWVTVPAASE